MMRVQVLCFGVLKDWFGAESTPVELPASATVAALIEQMSALAPHAVRWEQGIAVSVNAAYVNRSHELCDGDEVALLPPVSGGSASEESAGDAAEDDSIAVSLTHLPIDVQGITETARNDEDGAVVVFDGIVRNNTRGRKTLYLDYEAYDSLALKQMRALVDEATHRFAVRHASIVHRLGRLQVGETSVLIVVAAAHRGPAFEACRWLIDTLKKTVPIWKKETFTDGAVWADGEAFPAEILTGTEARDEK